MKTDTEYHITQADLDDLNGDFDRPAFVLRYTPAEGPANRRVEDDLGVAPPRDDVRRYEDGTSTNSNSQSST